MSLDYNTAMTVIPLAGAAIMLVGAAITYFWPKKPKARPRHRPF